MRLARSAPVKPGVRRARTSTSTPLASGLFLAWTLRMARRPWRSGRSTTIWRSNRPGRSRAGSRMSGRLVAAIRMTPALVSNPSISTRSWLSVCSRSSWPPPRPAPRWRPTASISSTNTMAGRRVLGLLEQVAHPAGADADEHLHEVGAGDGEERHAGLAGHGPGEERLARAGRAEQQHALGDLGPHGQELGRGLQELLDLLELLDGLVGAGHVGEGDLGLVLVDLLGLGLAELHDPAAAALHGVHDEQEGADEQDEGQERLQDRPPDGVVLVVDLGLDPALAQDVEHLLGVVADVVDPVLVAVLQLAGDGGVTVGDGGGLDLLGRDLGLELVEAELLAVAAAPEQPAGHDDDDERDRHPERGATHPLR